MHGQVNNKDTSFLILYTCNFVLNTGVHDVHL